MIGPNLSSTQWILLLLMLLIQSSMGMSLSLSAIWSYKVKLVFLIGETEAAIFYWFSLTALGTNLIIFSSSITFLSVFCGELGMDRDRGRTVLVGGGGGGGVELWRNEARRGYGAMGFYSGEVV